MLMNHSQVQCPGDKDRGSEGKVQVRLHSFIRQTWGAYCMLGLVTTVPRISCQLSGRSEVRVSSANSWNQCLFSGISTSAQDEVTWTRIPSQVKQTSKQESDEIQYMK